MVFRDNLGRLLIFSLPFINVLKFLEPEQRATFKRHYRRVKEVAMTAGAANYCHEDVIMLVGDLVRAELKSRAYKKAAFVLIGPFIQSFTIPFFVVSAGSKIQRYVVAVAQLGALITQSQHTSAGFVLGLLDMFLLGEVVPTFGENPTFLIYHNDTSNQIMSIAAETLDKYELGSEVIDVASSVIETNANMSNAISVMSTQYELGKEVSEIASSIIPEVSANVSDVISTLNSFTPNITGTDLN